MYSKLSECVQVSTTKTTEYFKCSINTRQRDATRTIMYNLYINELSSFLHNKGHLGIFITDQIPDNISILFADDVENCADNAFELQSQINSISEFCYYTGMSINQ
jgi:hypothetical protein